ncbi:MAG: hypothetical protein ABR521_12785 [Gaiellaceae bacterium]
MLRGRVFPRALTGAALAAAVVLAIAPGSTAAPAAEFVPGDLVVSGAGLRWLHADGSVVGQIVPASVRVTTVAFRPGGGSLPLFAVDDPLVIRSYNASGVEQFFFAADDVAKRTTALALGPNGIEYPAVTHGPQINQVFIFKQDPTVGSNEQLVGLFLVPAPVTDLDAASDGCTVFYASALGIGRLDSCRLAVLPDFVGGLGVAKLRLLPDTSMLAVTAGGAEIRRIGPDAKTVRTYAVPGQSGWTGIDLAPDGRSFWAVNQAGLLYRIDLAGGAVLQGPLAVPAPATDVAVHGAPIGVAPPPPAGGAEQTLDLDRVATLTGEVFAGFLPIRAAPEKICGPGGATLSFRDAYGASIGPYRGGFGAGADVKVGPQTLPGRLGALGLPPGPVQSVDGAFAINQGPTKIQGTFSGKGSGSIASCAAFGPRTFPTSIIFPPDYVLSGYAWALSASALKYQASIARDGKAYSDRGKTYLVSSRFNLVDAAGRDSGSGGRYAQHFVSDAIGVTDAFASKGQKRPHSAGIPSEAATIELRATWTTPADRFTIRNVKLVPARTVAAASSPRVDPVKVTTTRGPNSVRVRVSNVKSGRLTFSVNGERVRKKTKVKTQVSIVHRHRKRLEAIAVPLAALGLPPTAFAAPR